MDAAKPISTCKHYKNSIGSPHNFIPKIIFQMQNKAKFNFLGGAYARLFLVVLY
jgi:hypothetical protein